MESHARQEEHHREQKALLEAEFQEAMEHLESFQEAASAAEDLVFRPLPRLLRRMSVAGSIQVVREGKPNHEALYVHLPHLSNAR